RKYDRGPSRLAVMRTHVRGSLLRARRPERKAAVAMLEQVQARRSRAGGYARRSGEPRRRGCIRETKEGPYGPSLARFYTPLEDGVDFRVPSCRRRRPVRVRPAWPKWQ